MRGRPGIGSGSEPHAASAAPYTDCDPVLSSVKWDPRHPPRAAAKHGGMAGAKSLPIPWGT